MTASQNNKFYVHLNKLTDINITVGLYPIGSFSDGEEEGQEQACVLCRHRKERLHLHHHRRTGLERAISAVSGRTKR